MILSFFEMAYYCRSIPVVFCTSPQKNILEMIGGLGTVALSLVNNFTDVVSMYAFSQSVWQA